MDVALLFLPLIGGYIFSRRCNATRFACAREDGHRLYFRAGFYATFLFVTAALIRLLMLVRLQSYRDFEELLREIVKPFLKSSEHDYQFTLALTCIYAMVLGPLLAQLVNIVFSLLRFMLAVGNIASSIGAPFLSLPVLLFKNIRSFQEKALAENPMDAMLQKSIQVEMPIAVTMENRKVYVGFLIETPDPERDTKAIRILPLASGYRKQETLELELTTDYDWIYEQTEKSRGIQDDDSESEDEEPDAGPQHSSGQAPELKDFEVVIPMGRVLSVNLFDAIAYEAFRDNGDDVGASNAATP